jgi:hypothetical protein
MPTKVTGDLIQQYGLQLRELKIDAARAAELALEVERNNRAIFEAAKRLDFNDEPSRFASALTALKQSERAVPQARRSTPRGKRK